MNLQDLVGLYPSARDRYEAALAVPVLAPLLAQARVEYDSELAEQGRYDLRNDAEYRRAWYEASRWPQGSLSGYSPEDRRCAWSTRDDARRAAIRAISR